MTRRSLTTLLIAAAAGTVGGAAHAQADALKGDAPAAKVGDSWRWVRSDRRTGVKEAETARTITTVSPTRIEGTEDAGPVVLTGELSVLETADWVRPEPARFYDFPLAVGKKWSFKYVQNGKTNRYSSRWQYDAEVVGTEKIKTAAGEFDAFKVVYKGFWNNDTSKRNGSAKITNWYAPAARATARTEFEDGYNYNTTELIEVKLAP